MKAGGGDQKSEDAKSGMPNLADPIKQPPVRDQLAAEAGVSKMTYTNLRTVNQKGSDELKEAVREKKIGASKAASTITMHTQIKALHNRSRGNPG